MSDTPRTDAQHEKWRIDDDPYTSMMELARGLERENAALSAALNKIAAMHKATWSEAAAVSLSAIQPISPSANAAPQASGVPGLGRAHALSAEPAVAAPQLHTDPGHVQELDSRYTRGWNDAIEAAAVYCTHTLSNNHPAISSYFQHAAINIRTLSFNSSYVVPRCDYHYSQAIAGSDVVLADALRYSALKRQTVGHCADPCGYEAEAFDKGCDDLIEWFRKFDAGTLEICPNCDTALPQGCGGQFKQDGEACWWNRGK